MFIFGYLPNNSYVNVIGGLLQSHIPDVPTFHGNSGCMLTTKIK